MLQLRISLLWLCCILPLALQAEELYSVNLHNTDLTEFIDSVGRITGKSFLIDPRVRGEVSIRSQRQLTADEVFQVFLSQLRVNGFSAVQIHEDSYRIVPEQTARLEPIPVEDEQTPNSNGLDLLATRVLTLHNADAAQLVNILTPLMDRRIGVITHYAPTNVLILTDWGTNLERLANLVQRIDQASSENLSLIQLQHASASETEKLLTQLFRREGKTSAQPHIMSDSRLNVLLVRADQATRKEIQRLANELDQPLEQSSNTKVFYLRHAKATDMVTLLQDLSQHKTEANKTLGNQSLTLSQKTNIQAHEPTNSLVVVGSPDQLREMRLLIEQLDIRRAQVLVEAIIVEISEGRARELGINWLLADTKNGTVPLVSTNLSGNTGLSDIITGATSEGVDGALSALGSMKGVTAGIGRLTKSGLNFAMLINAFEGETGFNILSTPSILTLDNAEASILVGQEVPFVTGSTIADSNTNPFQTIQRREVGVKLQITPQINDGNTVRLEIVQEVSNIEDSTRASDIITNKREIKTTVIADNNDIIVLGGLVNEEKKEINSKVPLLGDIPLLGKLFRSSSIINEKRNLMVFIKPTILQDREALNAVSAQKYRFMHAAQILEEGDHERLQTWEQANPDQSTSLTEIFPSRREQRSTRQDKQAIP